MPVTMISLTYLPVAIGLGALHALEPGHAKAMTAAYLIGIHGRWTDAILLGLSAAFTHSLIVIGIAVTAVFIGREAFADQAIWWLQIGSGTAVVALGTWMMWRRLRPANHHHHHDVVPIEVTNGRHHCRISMTGSSPDERMKLEFTEPLDGDIRVVISRPNGVVELLTFANDPRFPLTYFSRDAPSEPHAFEAILELSDTTSIPFSLTEPDPHDHSHSDDIAHAKAHAAQMPGYVGSGTRPSWLQVIAFGAAGGLVPCPASISVMLLALSVGSTASGLVLVFGFSLGLALALVSVGLIVVTGMRTLGKQHRFSAWSKHAPVISAGVLIATGIAAILFGVFGQHLHTVQ